MGAQSSEIPHFRRDTPGVKSELGHIAEDFCSEGPMSFEEAREQWPTVIDNLNRIKLVVEHGGRKDVVLFDTLRPDEKARIWPAIVKAVGSKSGSPFGYDKDHQKEKRRGILAAFAGSDNEDDEATVRRPGSSGSISPDSASSIADDEQPRRPSPPKRQRSKSSKLSAKDMCGQIENTRALTIGNDEEVGEYLSQCLKEMQQDVCKLIAKPWIKNINPNKQTHHPYARGTKCAPPWWPELPPSDNYMKGRVRHQEPDHLLKDERIILLRHIAMRIAEPLQLRRSTMNNVNVEQLDKITWEAIGNKLEGEQYTTKKRAVQEFFKVSKHYQRYRNGEYDADLELQVLNWNDQQSKTPTGGTIGEDYLDAHRESFSVAEPMVNGFSDPTPAISHEQSQVQAIFDNRSFDINGAGAHYVDPLRAFEAPRRSSGASPTYSQASETSSLPAHQVNMLNTYSNSAFLHNQSRRTSTPWSPHSPMSPNTSFGSHSMPNGTMPFTATFAEPLNIPMNLNAAQGSYIADPLVNQMSLTNFQSHQGMTNGVSSPRRISRVGSHGHASQYPQPLQNFQAMSSPTYDLTRSLSHSNSHDLSMGLDFMPNSTGPKQVPYKRARPDWATSHDVTAGLVAPVYTTMPS